MIIRITTTIIIIRMRMRIVEGKWVLDHIY